MRVTMKVLNSYKICLSKKTGILCGFYKFLNVLFEIAQQVKLNNQEHEKAWLMRVCINICKNQIRYRNRHPKYNIEEVDVIGIELEEKEILREISLLPVKLKRKLSGSLLACSSQSDNLQHFVNSLIWQSQNDCPNFQIFIGS